MSLEKKCSNSIAGKKARQSNHGIKFDRQIRLCAAWVADFDCRFIASVVVSTLMMHVKKATAACRQHSRAKAWLLEIESNTEITVHESGPGHLENEGPIVTLRGESF